jgi:hypothetical protein
MSFSLFNIEFNGREDNFEVGKEKMDKVCKIVGEKFIMEWFEYWIEKGKVKRGNINDYYKCLKILEECNFSNLRDNFD